MSGRALPWLLAGGAAAVAALVVMRRVRRDHALAPHVEPGLATAAEAELRNAGLTYRPVGASGEPYPAWVRALDGQSGVYVIKEVQRDGSEEIVYVGESHTGRLYDTLTRHLQQWKRRKTFWRDQFGGQGHDPGLTYQRHRVKVAARVMSPERAMSEETRLIRKLRPRDNLLKQPDDSLPEDPVPF